MRARSGFAAILLAVAAPLPAHNALLDDGPLPLTVLEARIDQWIGAQRPVPARLIPGDRK